MSDIHSHIFHRFSKGQDYGLSLFWEYFQRTDLSFD